MTFSILILKKKYKYIVNSILLDVFSLQGKLRNHRNVFGHSAVEKYPVGNVLHFIIFLLLLIFVSIIW